MTATYPIARVEDSGLVHNVEAAYANRSATSAARCTCGAQWTNTTGGQSFALWAMTHPTPQAKP